MSLRSLFCTFALASLAAAQPRIDGIVPSSQDRSGRVRILGSGLGPGGQGSRVLIDGRIAWTTSWGDSRIVAYVPEIAGPGNVLVQVVTGVGQSNLVSMQVTPRKRKGRILWRFAADSDYLLHRAATGPDGTVYLNDIGGRLYALSPNGALKWIFDMGGQGAQGAAAVGHDGTAYVVGDPAGPDVHLFAVAPNGGRRWRFTDTNTQGCIAGPDVGPDGNVYWVTDAGGRGLMSISPSGQLLWSRTGNPLLREFGQVGAEIVFGSTPQGREQLYVAFDLDNQEPPRLFAFDRQGNQRFAVTTGAQTDVFLQFQSQPAVSPDGTVCVTSNRSPVGWVLEAFEPVQGAVHWQYQQHPANGMSPPHVAVDGAIHLVRSLAHLVRVTPAGNQVWRFEDATILDGPIAAPDGRTLFAGGQPGFGLPGFLRGFIASTGRLLWQVDLGLENGGYLVPDTRARFAQDGQTAYIGALILADDVDETYCYLYAIDTNPVLRRPGP